MEPVQEKGIKAKYLLGMILITFSFLCALAIGAYISQANISDDSIMEKYLPQLQAMELALTAKARELEVDNIALMEGSLAEDTVWIADLNTGEIVLASGRAKGINKDSVYDIYSEDNLPLAKIRIEYVFKNLSLGRIIDYKKGKFPEETRFFKAKL